MNLQINKQSVTPVYKQIANGIWALIREEELVNGYKLPSERQLARELGVHRNTVVRAYEELIAEGLVVAQRTSPRGYFVLRNEKIREGNLFFPLSKMIRYQFSPDEKTFAQIFEDSGADNYITLAGIVMDEKLSPALWMDEIFDEMKAGRWAQNAKTQESREIARLKENICRLLRGRNMYVNPKNVQLVLETTHALSVIIEMYLEKGDCVIVEEPVIPDTVNLFRNRGIETVYVSMEADGFNLKEMEILLMNKNPKFIYVMTNYQSPSGTVMSLEKRKALLALSHKYGVPIIEEDSVWDFNYTGKKMPTLYSMDCYKSVLYIDTFSLTFLPGIKTAFVVGPYEPIDMMGRYIIMSQVSIGNIGQYMLNEFIERGAYEKYLKMMFAAYKRKMELLCERLETIEEIRFTKPQGGLNIWCSLAPPLNEKELYLTCRGLGLLIMPGYLFYPRGYHGQGHVRLCFANIEETRIDEAVSLLKQGIAMTLEKAEERKK